MRRGRGEGARGKQAGDLLGRPGGGRRALHIGEMLGGDEIRIAGALLAAFLGHLLATPVAWRIAVRIAFFDHPVGYKEHSHPTPYLGGAAVMAGILAGTLIFDAAADYKRMLVAALVVCAIGTLDDRIGLGVTLRLIAQLATGGRALGRRPRLDDAAQPHGRPPADDRLGRRHHQRLQPDGQPGRGDRNGRGRLRRGHRHPRADAGRGAAGHHRLLGRGRLPGLPALQPRQAGEDLPRRRGQHADRPARRLHDHGDPRRPARTGRCCSRPPRSPGCRSSTRRWSSSPGSGGGLRSSAAAAITSPTGCSAWSARSGRSR